MKNIARVGSAFRRDYSGVSYAVSYLRCKRDCRQYSPFIKAFSWAKDFKEYFAVKATPNPYIMRLLQKKG